MINTKGMGCHVHQFPSGKWGFVGSVPGVLYEAVEPKEHHYISGRIFTDVNGKTWGYSMMIFNTEAETREKAKELLVELSN
jgi:hypothetical protein